MPFTPVVPISQVPTKAVSLDMSAKVSDKLPFILGEYSFETYPHVLKFDGTGVLEKAFKPETHYAFAVAVYGENKVQWGKCILLYYIIITLEFKSCPIQHI